MAIRKPIKISWEGVEQKIVVNMLLIERIDNEVGILKLLRMKPEDPKIFPIIKLLYILLDESGLDISLDDVYDGLGDKVELSALFSVLTEITPMIMPNFNGVAKKKPTPKKRRKPSKK